MTLEPQWIELRMRLNGELRTARVPAQATLLEVLRDHFRLTGTKEGCGEGECGACTVILDGELAPSCLVLAAQCEDAEVRTIEGVGRRGRLHPVQQAFIDAGAVQCGFCTPGMVLAAIHLLETAPAATPDEVRRRIAGNLCRCTGYTKILDAIERARRSLEKGEWEPFANGSEGAAGAEP